MPGYDVGAKEKVPCCRPPCRKTLRPMSRFGPGRHLGR
ncbi:hypothetical protein D1BOALGB6SA_6511 [Olavius sp. associated proteobacterium Delta 1]|nr:hypothetical protein D1BOALGB6SA_6511 [Olavius sp. associated proteobacterium Delta 1]